MTPDEVAAAAPVRRWFASAALQGAPPEDRQRRLVLLADFCRHTGQSPDELVLGCLRTTKAGDTAISAKRRRAMNATIDQFVAARGLDGRDAVVTGNTLRSFLVHNGIFIQGRPWRGERRAGPG
jgi:hypothetical protein